VKYVRINHPRRTLPAGSGVGIRGQATMLLQENPDRVGLWIFPIDNDILLLSELDQGSPGYLLKGALAAVQASPANLNPSTSAANTAQAPQIAAVAGQRITVNELALFASAAGAATVTVTDGVSTLNLGTVTLGTAPTILQVNETFGVGLPVTVNVGPAGAAVTTTVSASGTAGGVPGNTGTGGLGLATQQFGDVPICDQTRLYACSVSNVVATVDVMELVREAGGLGASPP